MGTRSTIAVKLADGRYSSIYCHWDGYLSHHGPILFRAYNSQKLAESLVKPGSLSVLDMKNGKPAGHTFDKRAQGYCTYYGRDRNEKDVAPTSYETRLEVAAQMEEYLYLFEDGRWLFSEDGVSFMPLLNAMIEASLEGFAGMKPLEDRPLPPSVSAADKRKAVYEKHAQF